MVSQTFQCKHCKFLRRNIKLTSETPIAACSGKTINPCNRYPQNILRHPDEPTCGEFRIKE